MQLHSSPILFFLHIHLFLFIAESSLNFKMLENRPEDALDSLVETVEVVKTYCGDCQDGRETARIAFTAGTAFTARSYLLMNP